MNFFELGFAEPDTEFPTKILQGAVDEFFKATQGLAELRLVEITGTEKITEMHLKNDFVFKVLLMSEYLPGYSFKVLKFGYDVMLYPVSIVLENDSGEELGLEDDFLGRHIIKCENEKSFTQTIGEIFRTKSFSETVGGLMKIARQKK